MSNPLVKALVKATGKTVEVYFLKTAADGKKWCDYADCKTCYHPDELEFLKSFI